MNGFDPPAVGRRAQLDWIALLDIQAGVVDRDQALRAGFSQRQVQYRLQCGAWRSIYPGVYATHRGPLSRNALLWAAVRFAGDGAMLSHQTAAEIQHVIDKPFGSSIHVTVPHHRRPARAGRPGGIVIHRSDQCEAQLVGPFTLPRTRIEDTVLDLVTASATFDQAYTWIVRAVSRQLVTADQLRETAAARRRVRWRDWLEDALADAREGVFSSLELRYVRDVERAHGLPKSEHQARRQLDGKAQYRDTWYTDYRVVVEVDGPAYHQNERVQLDKHRDNVNLAFDGVITHRFGPVAVTERACETAAMVAATLRRNGWPGLPHRCHRSGCVVEAVEIRAVPR